MITQTLEVDIAILGGGLAGLSLAAALATPEFSHLNILVIEPRETYVRDKTWSYWRQSPHAFSDAESAVWQAWQVQNAEKTVKIDSKNAENFVYASFASDDFYASALKKIAACQHVSLWQAAMVEKLTVEDNRAKVMLKNGSIVSVKQAIFDSRPQLSDKKPHLTQHFMGLQLMTQSPTFDVNTVVLMDFKNSSHGIHFIYVLPYSATEALVESTWICQHHEHEDYAQELQDDIATRWPNVKFAVKYTETGSLPLVTSAVTSKQHGWKPLWYWLAGHQNTLAANNLVAKIKVPVIDIGTRAGTARAATGYAFLETLADSARLANLIKKNLPLTAFKRNKIDAWMDTLFLSFLTKNPNMGADYFVRMFANCPPARLIRFLTGQASWLDRLSVIIAVPAWPMLKHLMFEKNNDTK
jgi:lycopene beta-cyclase